jgi:hypothetical protein
MEEFFKEVHKVKQYFSLGICADGFKNCEMFHFCDKLPVWKYFLLLNNLIEALTEHACRQATLSR